MSLYKKPKQIKYKKCKKGRLKKLEFKVTNLKFGTFGLKAAESGVIKSNQLLAAKQAIIKKIRKKGKIWVTLFPYMSITCKPNGSRMGKGKGPILHWAFKINSGTILFEICGPNNLVIFSALKTAGSKLPIKTKFFN